MKSLSNILLEVKETEYTLDGKMNWNDINCHIENKSGTFREGKDKSGKPWKSKMYWHYGRIPSTIGKDGDMIDVFVNPNGGSNKVFKVKQIDPDTKEFDENKYLLGANDISHAKKVYLAHYDSPKYFGSIEEIDLDDFKNGLKNNTIYEIKFQEYLKNSKNTLFEIQKILEDITDKYGRTLVKNKKTSNTYYVKNINPDLHIAVKHAKPKDIKKSEKTSDIVEKPVKELRKKFFKKISKKIEKRKQKIAYRNIFGTNYIIGQDKYNRATVYDFDGTEYDIRDFYDIAKSRKIIEHKLNNIHKLDLYLERLPKIDDSTLEKLDKSKQTYEILTDNIKLRNKISRSYPVIEYKNRKLIIGGRFKGYYLDDMINRLGRQIAGTSYNYGLDGKIRQIQYKENGLSKFRVENEAYITSKENIFHVVLPDWDKETKNKIQKLSQKYKSIHKLENNSFEFSIDNFEEINEALNGSVMSEDASIHISKYIQDKQNSIEQQNNEKFSDISTSKIDGMKTKDSLGNKIEFMAHQKRAIDFILKRGNGVVGLDTGTGKSLVSIGILLKWINDGTLKKNGNGRALYVVPPSLRGNIPGEILKFCENPQEVLQHTDIITYGEFQKNSSKYKKYGAVFFDEAQYLRGSNSKIGKVAKKFNHSNKILLTASVLEKSPIDLYNLVSIANNYGTSREEAKKFVNTFCLNIGGKVIGLKEDPETKEKIRSWIKQNTVYVDKEDVSEIKLPAITKRSDQNICIKMKPEMLKSYVKLSRPIKDTIKRMVEKYKNKTLQSSELNQELSKTMGQIQRLRSFLNNPDDFNPNLKNQKVEYAIKYVTDRLSKNNKSKIVTFTDSPRLAEKTAKRLSKSIPGKKHLLGLAGEIVIYQDGKILEKYKKSAKLKINGEKIPLNEWQSKILNHYQDDPNLATMNLTKAYTFGHNLQKANSMLHLDRNSWNNEHMKQRTARIWRTGQKNSVDVKIVDVTADDGSSIDEIQRYSQEIEQNLFDEIIKGSKDEKLKNNIKITGVDDLLRSKNGLPALLNSTVVNYSQAQI